MPSFSITPRSAYPIPTEPFEGGVQFRANGENVGPVGPAIVDLVQTGLTGTYDPDYGIVTYELSGEGGGSQPQFGIGLPTFGFSTLGAPPYTEVGIATQSTDESPSGNEMRIIPFPVNAAQVAYILENLGYRPRHYTALFESGQRYCDIPAGSLTSREVTDYHVYALRYVSDPGDEAVKLAAYVPLVPDYAFAGVAPTNSNSFSVTDDDAGGLRFTVNGTTTNTDATQFVGLYIVQHARTTDRSTAP